MYLKVEIHAQEQQNAEMNKKCFTEEQAVQ